MIARVAKILKAILIVPVVLLLNACSSGAFQDSSAESEASVVGLVNVPTIPVPNLPVTLKLEVQVRRAGFDGRVQLDFQDLPAGVSANSATLEPKDRKSVV